MSYFIKQSTAARPLLFLMVDSSDHIAGKTGLTPTVTISKGGASFATPAGAVTEVGSGWYQVAGNATDSNTLGPLVLHATATGADPTDTIFRVVAFDPDSATNLGLSAMPIDMTQAVPISNTAQTHGDALNAARAQGFGKWTISGTSLTLFAADGTTALRTFTLNSATAPTSRS